MPSILNGILSGTVATGIGMLYRWVSGDESPFHYVVVGGLVLISFRLDDIHRELAAHRPR